VSKRSIQDERQVLHFVQVSLDYSTERKCHVIGMNILPQVWKLYNLKMNKNLLQWYGWKHFSHRSVEDDQNHWKYWNTSALNSTAKHFEGSYRMWHSQIGGNGRAHHVHISTQWMNVNLLARWFQQRLWQTCYC
jgi:hypothetical protein